MPKSHPSRGAWIEIAATINQLRMALSHPSRGAWIEIFYSIWPRKWGLRRTPRGVRGLKSYQPCRYALQTWSHPSRGAWIEIRKKR